MIKVIHFLINMVFGVIISILIGVYCVLTWKSIQLFDDMPVLKAMWEEWK